MRKNNNYINLSWASLYVDASLVEELTLIIFNNHQPDDNTSGFIKHVKKDFDSLRFLRILGKMKDLEAKLDTQGRALKTMPVQSDCDDIEVAKRSFVGSMDLFKHHFEEHRKKLNDHLKSLQKYLTYHEEIATGFPDGIRYFHALYTDSVAVGEAYSKFDQRVDKQLQKLFVKIAKLKLDKTLEHVVALHAQTTKSKTKAGTTKTVFSMDTPLSPTGKDRPKSAFVKSREVSKDEIKMAEKIIKNEAGSKKTSITDVIRSAVGQKSGSLETSKKSSEPVASKRRSSGSSSDGANRPGPSSTSKVATPKKFSKKMEYEKEEESPEVEGKSESKIKEEKITDDQVACISALFSEENIKEEGNIGFKKDLKEEMPSKMADDRRRVGVRLFLSFF